MANEIKGLRQTVIIGAGNVDEDRFLDLAQWEALSSSMFNKTVSPTVNDDNTQGYFVGSMWIDITADRYFICLDNSTGAAIWMKVPDCALVSTTSISFRWSGSLSVVTEVDVASIVAVNSQITKVKVFRGTAGSGSSTIVDINKGLSGGPFTTLYTTQANRPTILPTDGNDFLLVATLPDIVSLTENEIITVDIDQVEVGGPKNLIVEIFSKPV